MNTSLTDAGVYSCIITNQYNTDTANATLNVQGLLIIIVITNITSC